MIHLTPRERFINALEGGPPVGRVPHFELVFYLTMEAFGRVHPLHRTYVQWDQMTRSEQRRQIEDVADVLIQTARQYDHSAIFVQHALPTEAAERELILTIREAGDDQYFLMLHGDATYAIPDGRQLREFSLRLKHDPGGVKHEAAERVAQALARAERLREHAPVDGFALCSDYCFNTGPFLSPAMFDEFITPYLEELTRGYRGLGYYVIKHTDGDIRPILDRLLVGEPHALHSLDPQAGVDIREIKQQVGDRVCLIGNVNCGLLDTGTDEECIASARYALQHGMPGGRYIFSTSNCVYTGMRLERYSLMHQVWREEGHYPPGGSSPGADG
jgi:uroporphyrinogen decarboxylase